MFLRRTGATWSAILLRDELLQAGIRHIRKPLKAPSAETDEAPETVAALAGRQGEAARPLGW